jgi:predicted HTH transcriptional regulator
MLDALHGAMGEAVLGHSSRSMSGKVSGKMSGKMLSAIAVNPAITIPALAALIRVSTRTIERHLRALQESGQLQRVGGARAATGKSSRSRSATSVSLMRSTRPAKFRRRMV